MIRSLIEHNRRVSRRIDILARTFGRRDGNYAFVSEALPRLLRPGQRVLDVGGGKNPGISLEVKQRLGLTVDGLDVSEDELRRAPSGAYDEIFVSDVAQARLARRPS